MTPSRPHDARTPLERTPTMPAPRQPSSTPNAVRMRRWRASTGRNARILVDLAALGAYLDTLNDQQAQAFARALGDDVARRARTAAQRGSATDLTHSVAR